ncbi:MAG TPA: hypothetical protein VMV90_01150 [Rectinemataceae bacterium]|nr:hypothetical protein [Rectinemataceae bacterium]
MIGLLVKIPFFDQIRKTEPRLTARIVADIEAAGRASAASLRMSDEPAFLSYDDARGPCGLRAAEAARLLAESLKALSPRLHGWCLILDSCLADEEQNQRHFQRLWLGLKNDGLFLGPGAAGAFEGYFLTAPEREEGPAEVCVPIVRACHARAAIESDGLSSEPPGSFGDRVIDELGALGIGTSTSPSLAILGPERAPAERLALGLEYLYGPRSREFLTLRSSVVSSSPYGPIVNGLSALISPRREAVEPALFLSGADRLLYDELGPMLDFLSRSPFRLCFSSALDVRLRVCAAAALRLYARERRASSLPAFVILEGLDRFSPESLSISALLLEKSLAEEGISVISTGSRLPSAWPLGVSRRLEMPAGRRSEGFRARAAARLAGAPPGGPVESKASYAQDSLVELARAALATFPREYAEILLALRLGEEVLRDEDLDAFLDSQGYVSGIRSFVYEHLAQLGFVAGSGRPRIASEVPASAAELVLDDGGRRIKTAFSARLRALHAGRRIIPSLALYRRMADLDAGGEAPSDPGFFLDCAAADALYGSSEPAAERLDSPLAAYPSFLAAYAAGNGPACERAASELELGASSGGRLGSDIAALARAAVEYANRAPAQAARRVKNALIDLHALGAQQSEPRAHRLLGLCALAQGQVQEGADYLANAFEIAQSAGNPLCSILASQAEAAAYLVLGDLGRTRARTKAFASLAAAAFRSDWEMAGAFMEGRIAFELGDYAAAERDFGRVRSQARVYGAADTALRAEIWIGRTAACQGGVGRARSILARRGDDHEALWFLAELELWEGRPREAAALLERALGAAPKPGFASADAFDWSSGFASIEGRAVGFAAGRSYVEDQISALRDFSSALASPDQAGERSERLALQAREERLAATHPAIHLYLFYRYRILRELGSGSMDAATVLSKAFKALQMRSTRISDATQKDSFMEKNRWNREILAEARRYKLI